VECKSSSCVRLLKCFQAVSNSVFLSKVTMSNLMDETQSLNEQQLFIRNELLPKISEMRRYLGAIDYNTEFYRRKRQVGWSWEFEDRDTKNIFKTFIIGEVADAIYGTLLNSKGNFKPPKSDPVRQQSFCECVKKVTFL